jgi:hypothetical protein
MEKVVDLLKRIKIDLDTRCITWHTLELLDRAIAELKKTPRWYTPEQWEAETGEPWPEYWPVWAITDGMISISTMAEEEERKKWGDFIYVCATEAGPPPDGWKPE